MSMRSAAVVAVLALGLMSGAATAAPIRYNVDYTLSNGVEAAHVTGYIETDGLIGSPLAESDIESFSISSNGFAETNFALSGDALSATPSGSLVYAGGGSGISGLRFYSSQTVASFYTNRGFTLASGYVASDDAVVVTFRGDFTVGTAAMSPVPLPASASMFGAALLTLGAAGYGLKRKNKAAAQA